MRLMGRRSSEEPLVVPQKVRDRARKAIFTGDPTVWVDQTLYLIGSNVTHHKQGDPRLDEAILSAQALLAMLVEMRDVEKV